MFTIKFFPDIIAGARVFQIFGRGLHVFLSLPEGFRSRLVGAPGLQPSLVRRGIGLIQRVVAAVCLRSLERILRRLPRGGLRGVIALRRRGRVLRRPPSLTLPLRSTPGRLRQRKAPPHPS